MKHIKSIYEYFDSFDLKGDYRKISREITNFGISLTNDWETSLSKDEIIAINWYRDGGYIQAADYLVTGKNIIVYDEQSRLEKPVKYFVDLIINSLDRAKLNQDIITYKGVMPYKQSNVSLLPVIKNLKVGNTFQFKTLISSTLHFEYSVFSFTQHSDINIIKFKLHKGDNAAYVSLPNEDFSRSENEILISPKTKFKITNIYQTTVKIYFEEQIANIIEMSSKRI